ncbi:MAG: hypothetical protein RSA10_03305 [Bacilli bacterium]
MKKVKIGLLTLLMVVVLSGCGNKALVPDKMDAKLKKEGFIVNDVTVNIKDQNVEKVVTANNKKYQFEYYVFKTEKLAKESYKRNKEQFHKYKKKSNKEKEKNKDNYDKYTLELSDTYDAVIRSKKVVVYVSVSMEHKGDVTKILNKLGL